MLRLVHLELIGAVLLVQLAGHRVCFGRLDLLLDLGDMVEVVLLQVVVKEAAGAFVLRRW